MNTFYGNIISHTPKSHFNIALRYPNASQMFIMIENNNDDKVPVYGYVLVDYNFPGNLKEGEDYEGGLYQFNNAQDQSRWGSKDLIINYDQTVWQKVPIEIKDEDNNIVINNTYRAISRLNSVLSNFESPEPHFKRENSIVTFQRLNGFPIVKVDIPNSYEDFGNIEYQNDVITFDQKAVEKFNNRYPESQLRGTPKKFPMTFVEYDKIEITKDGKEKSEKVTVYQSEYNAEEYKNEIDNQIYVAYEKLADAYTEIKDNQSGINSESDIILNNVNVIINNKNNINTSITEINNASTAIKNTWIEIDSIQDNITGTIGDITENINELKNKENSIKQAYEQLDSIYKSLENESIKLNTYNTDMNSTINTLNTQVSNITNIMDNQIKNNITNIINQVDIINTNIQSLAPITTTVSNDLNKLINNSSSANQIISASKENLTSIYNDLNILKTNLNTQSESLSNGIIDLNDAIVNNLELTDYITNIESINNNIEQELLLNLNPIIDNINSVADSLIEQNNTSYLFNKTETDTLINNIKNCITQINTFHDNILVDIGTIETTINNITNNIDTLINLKENYIEVKLSIESQMVNLNQQKDDITNINNDIKIIRENIEKYSQDLIIYNNNINSKQSIIDTNQDSIIQEAKNITIYNGNINTANSNIDTANSNIKQHNNNITTQLDIYRESWEDLVFYTEMDTWYINGFLPSLTTLTIGGLAESLKYFNTDTLEYPTK